MNVTSFVLSISAVDEASYAACFGTMIAMITYEAVDVAKHSQQRKAPIFGVENMQFSHFENGP